MNRNKIFAITLMLGGLLLAGCQSNSEASSEETNAYSFETVEVEIDPSWPAAPLEDVTVLDFYGLNDFHGALEYNPSSNEIGINRLATYLNQKKDANPDGTVILSAGDFWQGSADSNITRGRLVTDAMNLIGFEAMSIGNHEFDWGVSIIEENAERADFPFLGANIFEKETGRLADFAVPYTMIDRAGVRIGIIGTIGSTLESSILTSNVMAYDFIPIGPIVTQSAAYLREMGAKAIVLLNHNPDVDSEVLDDVDIVFNGHSHDTYRRISSGVPIMQAAYNGKAVAHVRMEYDAVSDELELMSYTIDSDIINDDLAEDATMKALYDQYLEDEINIVKNEVLGTASGYFAKNNLGELAVSTMLEFGSDQGARVAFHNTGGVRSTLSEGTITYGDIYKVFPFDNELIIVEVTGVELKWWLAQGNYVAGADEFTNTFANGDPIDNSSVYKIISINYLTEKHLTEEDQYPHNEDTIINTFAYVRELIKARWQDQGSLDPSDYIG